MKDVVTKSGVSFVFVFKTQTIMSLLIMVVGRYTNRVRYVLYKRIENLVLGFR